MEHETYITVIGIEHYRLITLGRGLGIRNRWFFYTHLELCSTLMHAHVKWGLTPVGVDLPMEINHTRTFFITLKLLDSLNALNKYFNYWFFNVKIFLWGKIASDQSFEAKIKNLKNFNVKIFNPRFFFFFLNICIVYKSSIYYILL